MVLVGYGASDVQAVDKCTPFDTWIGGERFGYRVDNSGNWNLTADVQEMTTVTFKNSGLWEYYSESERAKYVIVFLSLEPTGSPLGQHDICVYKVTDDE